MPANDLGLLTQAASEAAEIAMRHWRTDQAVWDKDDGAGPVSEADYAVDTHLRERLLTARPGYGWLSEETEDDPARLDRGRVFIVDPIDGTRAFVAHRRTWALSLAVAEAGQVTAAVVHMPARDKVYSAMAGGGAHLNGSPIGPRPGRDRLDGAAILAPKSNLDPAHWTAGTPPVERHFRPSLAYRLCLIAEGRFDAMLTFRDAWEWDIAAGALIAAEAGARVTDRAGRPLQFNSPRAKTAGVLVAPPATHALLRAALA